MDHQTETGSGMKSGVRKGIIAGLLVAAVALLLLFLLSREGKHVSTIVKEGDKAPQFQLAGMDGKQISLSDTQGKVTILHFWATWCPPCVEEMPLLEKLYRTLPKTDFSVLAVSVDEGGNKAVGSFIDQNNLTVPVLRDPGGRVSREYGTFKFPETYILDRAGIVKYKIIGPVDWTDAKLVQALNELAGAGNTR